MSRAVAGTMVYTTCIPATLLVLGCSACGAFVLNPAGDVIVPPHISRRTGDTRLHPGARSQACRSRRSSRVLALNSEKHEAGPTLWDSVGNPQAVGGVAAAAAAAAVAAAVLHPGLAAGAVDATDTFGEYSVRANTSDGAACYIYIGV